MSDDGIVNAEPAGGWTDGDVADGQTQLSSAEAASLLQEESPDIEVGERREPDPVSAEAGADADPDLSADDQADAAR